MKPLEAVSVLDLTEGNPIIGSVFADYGATVLKVEKPQGGDDIRRQGRNTGGRRTICTVLSARQEEYCN